MSTVLQFETLHNTRDLGGMAAGDGRIIKPGKLIRSGRLSDISQNDMGQLSSLIDVVVDFRDVPERLEKPDRTIPGVTCFHIPILEKLAPGVTQETRSEKEMFAGIAQDPKRAKQMICGIYRRFALDDFSVSQYRKFLRILLEEHEKAVLWHCSAGKDRAGMASVIIEEILGISREDIIADYLQTNDCLADDIVIMTRHAKEMLQIQSPEADQAFRCLFGADPDYIRVFYEAAEEKYGDFRTFIHDGMQLTDQEILRLQEMYLW
ncbi:MAG: tyrosine-protein phosphatase [Parasporobacterium sp.]|nr:tyrosine-protein phosphatase [Parasporobacterium sp.]